MTSYRDGPKDLACPRGKSLKKSPYLKKSKKSRK